MLHIDPLFYLFTAILLLIVPLPWLAAAVFAAAVHETAHLVMILLTGGNIKEISISISGAKIHAFLPGNAAEFFCALAGPVGSLLLLLFCPVFPRLALCGLIQGIFNLYPVYPLDGGRMLHCILYVLFPTAWTEIARIFDDIFAFILLMVSIFAAIFASTGPIPILISFLFLCNRKKTCKPAGIGIQ